MLRKHHNKGTAGDISVTRFTQVSQSKDVGPLKFFHVMKFM